MTIRRLLLTISISIGLTTSAFAGGGNVVCEEPNVMILLDYSGSMRDDGKWTQAVSAVNQLTNIFGNTMRIGLTLFPFGSDCGVNSSNTVFPCQLNSAVPIGSILSTLYPDEYAHRTSLRQVSSTTIRSMIGIAVVSWFS